MESNRLLRRLTGLVSAALGFSALMLPVVSAEVSAFGFSVSSDSYTLIEILDFLEQLDRDTLKLKMFIASLSIGSILTLSTLIARWKVAVLGVLIQLVAIALMVNRAMNLKSNLGSIEVIPEIGFYTMVLAPVIGVILIGLPVANDLIGREEAI